MKKQSSTNAFVKECIYTALLQLMEQQPYSEITVTDIAKRAGVSRMAYYRNYQSKDDILIENLDQMLHTLEKHIAANMHWKEIWMTFFQSLRQSRLISAILKAGLLERLFQCIREHAYYIFQEFVLWDMTDHYNMLLVDCQVGALLGILHFLEENAQAVSDEQVGEFQKKVSMAIQQLAHQNKKIGEE